MQLNKKIIISKSIPMIFSLSIAWQNPTAESLDNSLYESALRGKYLQSDSFKLPCKNEEVSKIRFVGIVRLHPAEGGFFYLIDNKGEKYFPYELDKKYQQDGLKVRVIALMRDDVLDIYGITN